MRKKIAKSRGKRKPTRYGRSDLFSMASDVATKGLTLGLGATMLLAEGMQRFFKEAIERGEEVDVRRRVEKLVSISKKQADNLRSLLEESSRTGTAGLGAKIKQRVSYVGNRVQSSFKRSLQELNQRILGPQRKSGKP